MWAMQIKASSFIFRFEKRHFIIQKLVIPNKENLLLTMRKSDRLIKAGLLTAIIGLVSILNIFAFRATQSSTASSIQGVAYFDCNYNGLKEVGENGFPNMDVLLTGRNSLGDTITQITTTDGAGLYAFTGVDAGIYRVKYTFPGTSVNLIFSPQNVGGDDGVDSDPNAAGYTDPLSVDGITNIGAVDAGVIDSVCPVIYYTNPLIATLLDGDTLTVGCDNIPIMDGSWARGVNNSGGANLPVAFDRVLVRNGNCKQDGFVQFFVCTWTAQNLCNHQTQVRLYLKTIDTTPPTLTAPNDTTINLMLGDVVPTVPSSIPSNDNCSGTGSKVTYRNYETADPCGKIITRIWAAEDACGNQTVDTQRITVVLNPLCNGTPSTDTIILAPFRMTGNTKDTCLAAYLGSNRVLKNTWTLSSTHGVSATVIGDSCVTLTCQPGFSGRDTMAGWHCDGANANCRFFLLVVNILPNDPSCHLVAADTLIPISVACGSNGSYCLTGLNDINNFNNTYSIADNGAAYSGSFNSCSKDTTFSYAYYTLPFMGLSGKYRLDYWKLNGSNVTIASFDSLPQLVDTMRIHDPSGNWAINPANYTITGGTMANIYGQIKVTKISNGAVGTANVTTNIADSGIKMAFRGGLHTVIFTKTLTGCKDTLNVNVFCDTILLPVAVNDNVATNKNINLHFTPLTNDTINGTLLSLGTVTAPNHGSMGFIGVDSLVYTPLVDYCGNDTIQYRVCRTDFKCDTAFIYITVNCPVAGSAPVALDDAVSTLKNTTVKIIALANDTTNGVLIKPLSIVANPKHGTLTVDGSNNINYLPALNFCGAKDTLGYEICNANGCDTGWVFITINCPPVILYPIALNDAVSTLKNASITINVLSNDTLNGGLKQSIRIVQNPTKGTANVNGFNYIVFNPQSNFCGGQDSLSYEICNANGCDTAWVYITINCPALVLPIAKNDAISTLKNRAITINVLLNDNTNGALISPLSIASNPSNGTVSVDGSNKIVYTPDLDFCGGNDILTYVICNADGCDTAIVIITINCPIIAPIAVDDAISLDKNTLKLFKPTVNDTLNGSLFSINIITLPSNGTIGFISIDSLIYTPFIGFCGKDTITYSVCNQGRLCDTATITATINCTDSSDNSRRPVAMDDAVSTLKNTPINIAVIANDSVNGALSRPLSISGNSKHGMATVNGNQITYSPALDFCGGNDTLSYVICNSTGCDTGWVFITVNCTGGNNNANQPIALNDNVSTGRNTPFIFQPTKNDTINGTLASLNIISTAKHGTLAFAGIDSLVYYPQAGYCGNDTIIYSICNQFSLCDTATIIVNITCDTVPAGNGKRPVAVDDLATTLKNTAINIAVLTNDTINGGLTRPLSILGNPSKGTAVVSANDIVYTPQTGFCGGTDTVSYEICNANGCDTGWVFITVNCPVIILKPDAVNDLVTTTKNTQVVINVLANDIKNGTLTRTTNIVRQPSRGTAIVNFSNKIVYIPQAGFCGGSDTLTYEICNADGCDTALVFINIQCVGINPDAIDDVATVNKNVSTTLSVLANDAVNGTLSRPLSIVTPPNHGTATVDANNNISYTPTTNFCGANDTLTYEICNNNGCDTAQLIITVSCPFVLNRPDAVDDYTSTFKNIAINVDALTNDKINGILDSISIINAPKHGSVNINGLKIQYQPDSTFCGSNDTLSYSVCTSNGCDTAQIIVSVSCDIISNTPPDAVDDATSTIQGRSLTMVVLANDLLHGAALDKAKIIQVPHHGSARFDSFGNIFYNPNANFCGGNDTLTYQICTHYGCDTAQVVISVTCDSLFNLLPIATLDNAATARGISIIMPVLQNDTLNGADTFRIITFGKHGSAVFNNINSIVYQPDSIFCNGKDTLVYEICNIKGCATAKVIIDVTCDSIAKLIPIANADTATTATNTPVMIDILKNDTLRGAKLPVIISEPKKGIVIILGDKQAMYIPNIDAFGRDTFTYVICNAFGCDTTTVGIFIMAGDSVKIFNGFSPNGDGMNDRFVIKGIENYPNNEVYIYNRWGTEVYKTKGYTNDNGWDGSWVGRYLPDGTYFIVIVYNDEKKQRMTGYIQIHR